MIGLSYVTGVGPSNYRFAFSGVPSIGEFQAPANVTPDTWFYLNATVVDPAELGNVTRLVNATVGLTGGIILKWDNATDAFSEYADPSNYATLNTSGSFRTALNSTAYKLSWRLQLAQNHTEGNVSVTLSNTRAFDSGGIKGSGYANNLFLFFKPTLSFAFQDQSGETLSAETTYALTYNGSTLIAERTNGQNVSGMNDGTYAVTVLWDRGQNLTVFETNVTIAGADVTLSNMTYVYRSDSILVALDGESTISGFTWDSNLNRLSFTASPSATSTGTVKIEYPTAVEKPTRVSVNGTSYAEGSIWTWDETDRIVVVSGVTSQADVSMMPVGGGGAITVGPSEITPTTPSPPSPPTPAPEIIPILPLPPLPKPPPIPETPPIPEVLTLEWITDLLAPVLTT